jgi:stearoyl-CoA desaturase (delta-9 desaturase)
MVNAMTTKLRVSAGAACIRGEADLATGYSSVSGDDAAALTEGTPEVAVAVDPPPLFGVHYGGPAAKAKNVEVGFYIVTKQGGAFIALWWIATQHTGWVEWSGFLTFYVLSLLGTDLSFHRYFSHSAFKTSKVIRYALGILMQIASIGSLRTFIADHRRHHACTDRPGDPHSPYFDGHGRPLTGWKGLRHAHYGWALDDTISDLDVYGKGLREDAVISFCHDTRVLWYVVSALVLPALWACAFGGPEYIPGTILIAGFLRMAATLHGFALINSLGHYKGSKPFETGDESRNNWIVAIVALGEGWHNNHHAQPRVAFHGLSWRQPDPTGWVILLFERLGLIWDVQRPKRVSR